MRISIVPVPLPNHHQFIDRTGHRYARLTVVAYAGKHAKSSNAEPSAHWWCACDCGNYKRINGASLSRGLSKSCGCYKQENIAKLRITHGLSSSAEHSIWGHIKQRCFDVNCKSFGNYGGRGIKMCDRWKDSFENFYADMGPRPGKRYTLDRIDNDGDYEPSNCRWATHKQQNNNRRDNRLITAFGKTQTLAQWSDETGVKRLTIAYRIDNGWDIETALTKSALKSGPVLLTAFGKTQNLTEWAKEMGMNKSALSKRLKAGWALERALTQPMIRGRK